MQGDLEDRVEDLEREVYGDPRNPKDTGLRGAVQFLRTREIERDGFIKAARIIGLLLGVAIAGLTLINLARTP